MSEFTIQLKRPLTEEEMDIIQDSEMEHTNSITFHTKKGKEVKFIKAPAWLPIDKEKLEAGEIIEDGAWCFFTNGKSISVERYKADVIGHFFPPGRFFSLDEAIAFIPIPEELFESAKHIGGDKT